ncbi:hypothetical protein PybrP1_008159, partial [[Pythium] brassicae (nom. inval.)]
PHDVRPGAGPAVRRHPGDAHEEAVGALHHTGEQAPGVARGARLPGRSAALRPPGAPDRERGDAARILPASARRGGAEAAQQRAACGG